MADHNNLTTEQLIAHAHQAHASGEPESTAAYASLAAVGLLQQFLELARDGMEYEWSRVELPGGGWLVCVCSTTMFTEYPTTGGFPWVICGNMNCDAVWSLGDSETVAAPTLIRSGAMRVADEPAWQENDLVRHRNRYGTPIGEREADLVALLQRPKADRPGWWEAMVLRSDPLTGIIVGQGITLHEGGANNRVARFPD